MAAPHGIPIPNDIIFKTISYVSSLFQWFLKYDIDDIHVPAPTTANIHEAMVMQVVMIPPLF